jgi:alkanesulfonate monooxygenase SsuD/methylene tetrahydromethanopterin reductase-like flavin-dependent oxidoreductase (luciferase family)
VSHIPGLILIHSNPSGTLNDYDFVHAEANLAILAEEVGFGSVWCVEHHFDREYSMSPDNFMFLTHIAAKTSTIKIALGAVILPWNNPLRVAERISYLDILSNGRLIVAFGRGLSRHEYDRFSIDMATARERWEESYEMIRAALESGYIEGDGPYYPQPKANIVPFSGIPLEGRTYEIATSPESHEKAGGLGLKMAAFAQFPVERHKELFDVYSAAYVEAIGQPAPPPSLTELVTVHSNPDEAKRLHYEHLGNYFGQLMRHYELGGDHFAKLSGYESYATIATAIQAAGMDTAARDYIETNSYGTPDQFIAKIKRKQEVFGQYNLNVAFSFGGRSHEEAEEMMRLFAAEVMPAISNPG